MIYLEPKIAPGDRDSFSWQSSDNPIITTQWLEWSDMLLMNQDTNELDAQWIVSQECGQHHDYGNLLKRSREGVKIPILDKLSL